jgi:hypothetical protein
MGTEAVPQSAAPTQAEATLVWPTLAPRPVPSSEPGLVSAFGYLVVMNPLSAIPAPDDAIYLVPMVSGEENIAALPPLDDNAIQAVVDETTGDFYFVNIPPGEYFLMVREKSGTVLPARLGNSDSMAFFQIQPNSQNEPINLGLLSFP